MSVDIEDVMMCATFGDDRLRGLDVAKGRISRFPIDLRRRHYNTLALPCGCVMGDGFGSGRVGPEIEDRLTGRVTIFVVRVGSGLVDRTRVQLWNRGYVFIAVYMCDIITEKVVHRFGRLTK